MAEKIKGILLLCLVYRLITGEWPDMSDPECQRAVESCLVN